MYGVGWGGGAVTQELSLGPVGLVARSTMAIAIFLIPWLKAPSQVFLLIFREHLQLVEGKETMRFYRTYFEKHCNASKLLIQLMIFR